MKLKKSIGVFSGIAIAVGMVIGSGLFGLPGLAIQKAGVNIALVGWLLTIIVVMPLIYIFIKLGIKFPQAAGLSKYAEVAVGKWGSSGVTAVLSGTYSIGIPALAMIGASYLTALLNLNDSYIYVFSLIILFISTIINIYGVNMASWINTFSIIFILGLIVALTFMHPEYISKSIKMINIPKIDFLFINKLWIVMTLLFWAFLGWENLSFGLEEFKNPQKTIPTIYWGSFFIVSLFYIMLALISSGASYYGIIVEGTNGIASLLIDSSLGKVLIIVIVFIILANANSWVFGASRLIYSAGESGILPNFLGKLNKKSIPSNSLITLFVVYTLIILGCWFFNIDISKIILVVSQNFLILYLISILAFAKLFKAFKDRIVLLLASFSMVFFLSGFGVGIIYPIALLTLGYLAYKKRGE